jgi:hypothetical protein
MNCLYGIRRRSRRFCELYKIYIDRPARRQIGNFPDLAEVDDDLSVTCFATQQFL